MGDYCSPVGLRLIKKREIGLKNNSKKRIQILSKDYNT